MRPDCPDCQRIGHDCGQHPPLNQGFVFLNSLEQMKVRMLIEAEIGKLAEAVDNCTVPELRDYASESMSELQSIRCKFLKVRVA